MGVFYNSYFEPFVFEVIFIFFFSFSVRTCQNSGNGGCMQICNKNGDELECSCREGFKLNDDKLGCSERMLFVY